MEHLLHSDLQSSSTIPLSLNLLPLSLNPDCRFPCDLCHEEFSDGHEMKWALRMVCGYCSFEQPCQALCKNCGRKVANNAGGWLEGG